MLKKFFALLAVAVLLTGCETLMGDDKDGASNVGTLGTDSGISTGNVDVVPGSPEDFVANVGDRVFFGYDSAVLDSSSQQTLTRQASWLQANPALNIVVEGHCDERGTREYNLALGERRATAVKNYLASLGVAKTRITTISYGKEHPEVLGSNEESWSKNRRSVTVVTK